MDGEVHRRRGALEERGELVGPAVVVRVLEDADAIVFRAGVVGGTEVRVALDDE